MNKNMLLIGSVVLIILAIGMVAILEKTGNKDDNGTGDVRARAAVSKTLMMNGIIDSYDENAGTVTISRVFLADESRSGEAKDLGTWVVTPPSAYAIASLQPGTNVLMGVDAKSFLASKHTLTAVSLIKSR